MAFPTSSLTNNQVHKEGNRAFVYDSALGVWDQVPETDRTENKILTGEIGSGVAVSLGNNTTFPAGHIIKQSLVCDNESAAISTTSTSYVSTGIEVVHVTAKSSTDSYLIYEYYGGMDHTHGDGYFYADILMRDNSSSTYDVAQSLHKDSTYGVWYKEHDNPTFYGAKFIRTYCGLVSEMGMPTAKSSWAAGDTLYFRLFYKHGGATSFSWSHADNTWNATVTEVLR